MYVGMFYQELTEFFQYYRIKAVFWRYFMDLNNTIELVILAILIIQFIVMILLFVKTRQGSQIDVLKRLNEFGSRLGENELIFRTELGNQFGQNRGDLTVSLKSVSEQLSTTIASFTNLVENKINSGQGY
jgi:hypothetical protein